MADNARGHPRGAEPCRLGGLPQLGVVGGQREAGEDGLERRRGPALRVREEPLDHRDEEGAAQVVRMSSAGASNKAHFA